MQFAVPAERVFCIFFCNHQFFGALQRQTNIHLKQPRSLPIDGVVFRMKYIKEYHFIYYLLLFKKKYPVDFDDELKIGGVDDTMI